MKREGQEEADFSSRFLFLFNTSQKRLVNFPLCLITFM